jgi:cobalt-zinc-cadmium efflux system membrane fusion protein
MRPSDLLRLHLIALCNFSTLSACKPKEAPPTTQEKHAYSTETATALGPSPLHVDPSLLDAGRLRTAAVERRAPTGLLRLPADVVASAEGTAEAGTLVPARVARFEAREGDRVKRGDILAWLDAPEAARAVADVVRARARTEAQAKKLARLESLVKAEATSALAVDEARLELDIARADLVAARTVIASLGVDEPAAGNAPRVAAQVPVRSPVDGIVVERAATLGAHVGPEHKLFRLVREGLVVVHARIADGSAAVPAVGAAADITPRGSRNACKGRVVAILPEVDPATRTRTVRIAPDAPCSGLVAGGQAEATLTLEPPDGAASARILVIPSGAAVEIRGAPFAFVSKGAPATFEARPLELGPRLGEWVVVNAGLTEGDQVVTDGAILLKGELIRSELGGEP